jgi:hypothetical protein
LVGRKTTSKAGTPASPCGRPSNSPVSGVPAVEHPHERLGGGGALLAERGSAPAEPAAWRLAVPVQVLLAVLGDLADVVVLAAHRQLGDVHNHP